MVIGSEQRPGVAAQIWLNKFKPEFFELKIHKNAAHLAYFAVQHPRLLRQKSFFALLSKPDSVFIAAALSVLRTFTTFKLEIYGETRQYELGTFSLIFRPVLRVFIVHRLLKT